MVGAAPSRIAAIAAVSDCPHPGDPVNGGGLFELRGGLEMAIVHFGPQ
jgi:hypothetical protein